MMDVILSFLDFFHPGHHPDLSLSITCWRSWSSLSGVYLNSFFGSFFCKLCVEEKLIDNMLYWGGWITPTCVEPKLAWTHVLLGPGCIINNKCQVLIVGIAKLSQWPHFTFSTKEDGSKILQHSIFIFKVWRGHLESFATLDFWKMKCDRFLARKENLTTWVLSNT